MIKINFFLLTQLICQKGKVFRFLFICVLFEFVVFCCYTCIPVNTDNNGIITMKLDCHGHFYLALIRLDLTGIRQNKGSNTRHTYSDAALALFNEGIFSINFTLTNLNLFWLYDAGYGKRNSFSDINVMFIVLYNFIYMFLEKLKFSCL